MSYLGSPGILLSPPPSPSCAHPNSNGGDIFFPRSASNHSNIPQITTPSAIRMNDEYRLSQWSPGTNVNVPRRR